MSHFRTALIAGHVRTESATNYRETTGISLAACAQQPAMPVVGYLDSRSEQSDKSRALHR